jgi:hypothetical protein
MRNIVEQLSIQAAVRKLAANSKDIKFDTERAIIERHVLYCRKAVGGKNGITQLLQPQDVQKDGVRNIDSARLVTGEAFICTGLVISTASHNARISDESKLSSISYSQGVEEAADGQFFNNEFSLKIQNKEKLKVVLRHAVPNNTSDENFASNCYEVSPFVIGENQTILPELNIFNPPVANDTSDVVIEVALVGYRVSANNA